MVEGALHASQLRGLDVERLDQVVGEGVDVVGHTGQRLRGVALGLLQGALFIRRLHTQHTKKNGSKSIKRS